MSLLQNSVMYKYIVIIPARGGSKRFPGKNIYPLNGKPLLSYSIEYVKKIAGNMDIYVSTDSQAIGSVAIEYGAKIIQRPAELSGDYVTTAETLQHCAKELLESNVEFDYLILLQPTNPLRPDELLRKSMEIMNSGNYDSLITISPSYAKLGKMENGCFVPWNYKYGQRSQDMEALYYENGLLYITKKELILDGKITGEKMYPMIIEHIYGTIDIDTIEDLQYAEFVLNRESKL